MMWNEGGGWSDSTLRPVGLSPILGYINYGATKGRERGHPSATPPSVVGTLWGEAEKREQKFLVFNRFQTKTDFIKESGAGPLLLENICQ